MGANALTATKSGYLQLQRVVLSVCYFILFLLGSRLTTTTQLLLPNNVERCQNNRHKKMSIPTIDHERLIYLLYAFFVFTRILELDYYQLQSTAKVLLHRRSIPSFVILRQQICSLATFRFSNLPVMFRAINRRSIDSLYNGTFWGNIPL